MTLAGCASWHAVSQTDQPDAKPAATPTQAVAPNAVTLETSLIRFDETRQADLEQIWQAADESILEYELRRTLDANGIRVGVFRGELPQELLRQINQKAEQQQADIVEQLGLGADMDPRSHTLTCRSGRRRDWVIRREIRKPLSVVTTQDGNLSGQLFEKASAVLALTTYPQRDGKTLIELVPEIQFGAPKNAFVTGEFGMRQELKRESKSWKQFKIRTPMAPSEVLMIASTLPPKALGHAFFTTETADQSEEHVVALVKFTSTTKDTLFEDDVLQQARAIME